MHKNKEQLKKKMIVKCLHEKIRGIRGKLRGERTRSREGRSGPYGDKLPLGNPWADSSPECGIEIPHLYSRDSRTHLKEGTEFLSLDPASVEWTICSWEEPPAIHLIIILLLHCEPKHWNSYTYLYVYTFIFVHMINSPEDWKLHNKLCPSNKG